MSSQMAFTRVRQILVIKLRHIGDVLLTVPVFRALRENFPDARISALVNSGTEDVLRGNTLIDEILVFERAIKGFNPIRRYVEEIGFLGRIRSKGFDMTVDLTGGDRAAILSLISGAQYRLGWRPRNGLTGKRHLYTHLTTPDGTSHMALQNLEVVRQHGINTEDHSVSFSIPESDRAFVRKLLEENGISERDTFVHVHPTSRWLFKCWNDGYMADVIGWLLGRGASVVVTSSFDRREMDKVQKILSLVLSRFTSHASRLIDLCGKTTLGQLAAISGSARVFFGVDSAPMHIAAAVGTPVVALFGPSGAFNWGPWDNDESSKLKGGGCPGFTDGAKRSRRIGTVPGDEIETPYPKRSGIQTFGIHTVIQRDWGCIPCGEDGCEGSKISRCLEDISVAEVKDIVSRVLKGATG